MKAMNQDAQDDATGRPEEREERKDDALAVLRTETALSRFPMHRLTKGKNVHIELKNQASAVQWKLSHNSEYGQPGALAYKIDTLLVNRRIEESGRPVPKIIRLGSLREIAEEVGLGRNTNAVKLALLQNATATITAKISYHTQDGGEQWLEAAFSRYSIVFTGQRLPQGGSADGVCLVLNDIYQQILNTAIFRPLDYEYMKVLPPIAQRFYEIVSYQIYAAVRHGNPRAKLAYSDYCLLSTATRYLDFDHVKKQMYKVLRPHIQSGYIAKVEYEATTNERDEPDWVMYFTPGLNANREYRAFTGQNKTRKPRKTADETLTLPFPEPQEQPVQAEAMADAETASVRESRQLIEQLVQSDLNRPDAERFARERPDVCQRQLEYLPHVRAFKSSRGAYLRRAIEGDFAPPAAYLQAQEKERARRAEKLRRERVTAQATDYKSRQTHQERFYGAYLAYLRKRAAEVQEAQEEAFSAFLRHEEQQRQRLLQSPLAQRPMFQATIQNFDEEKTRLERFGLYFRDSSLEVLDFWAWDTQLNPQGLQA
jgi:hypothetical protein